MTEDAGPDLAADPSGSPLRVNRVQPAYQQVADQLRDRILDGSLSTDDRLPTEVELSEIFGVSRSTVREALRLLASRGLSARREGPPAARSWRAWSSARSATTSRSASG